MKKHILAILTLGLSVSGCVETTDNHCKSTTWNFSQGYECIKHGYSNAYSPESPIKGELNQALKCGEELSNLTVQGKLTDQQAWYLFWHARNADQFRSTNSPAFVCVDWDYLHSVETAVKADQEKRHVLNN